MEQNFVVIELKSKEEKVKILTFLASETEADYKVTSDLKKFVSEKYNVSCMDKSFFVSTPYENYADMYNSNRTNADIVRQSSGSVENFPPSVDYEAEQDEKDVFAAYTEPLRIPQYKENVDQINGLNFLDENYYELSDDDMESTTTVESTPSTSNAPKRGATNEPAFPIQEKQARRNDKNSNGEKCKICGHAGQFDSYTAKYRHVIAHMKIKCYECLVQGCTHTNGSRAGMVRHMQKHHTTQLQCFGLIQFERQENEEMEAIMRGCFPLPDTNSIERYCRVCHQFISGEGDTAEFNKRTHAQNHLDFTLFKCSELGCRFEGKTRTAMQAHHRVHPDVENPKVDSLPLNKDQNDEIESTFLKCFPEYQTNGGDI